jgi:hypothetical protein
MKHAMVQRVLVLLNLFGRLLRGTCLGWPICCVAWHKGEKWQCCTSMVCSGWVWVGSGCIDMLRVTCHRWQTCCAAWHAGRTLAAAAVIWCYSMLWSGWPELVGQLVWVTCLGWHACCAAWHAGKRRGRRDRRRCCCCSAVFVSII